MCVFTLTVPDARVQGQLQLPSVITINTVAPLSFPLGEGAGGWLPAIFLGRAAPGESSLKLPWPPCCSWPCRGCSVSGLASLTHRSSSLPCTSAPSAFACFLAVSSICQARSHLRAFALAIPHILLLYICSSFVSVRLYPTPVFKIRTLISCYFLLSFTALFVIRFSQLPSLLEGKPHEGQDFPNPCMF